VRMRASVTRTPSTEEGLRQLWIKPRPPLIRA
jgi:hypothetical protein